MLTSHVFLIFQIGQITGGPNHWWGKFSSVVGQEKGLVVVYFILRRLLYLAFSANLGLLLVGQIRLVSNQCSSFSETKYHLDFGSCMHT